MLETPVPTNKTGLIVAIIGFVVLGSMGLNVVYKKYDLYNNGQKIPGYITDSRYSKSGTYNIEYEFKYLSKQYNKSAFSFFKYSNGDITVLINQKTFEYYPEIFIDDLIIFIGSLSAFSFMLSIFLLYLLISGKYKKLNVNKNYRQYYNFE